HLFLGFFTALVIIVLNIWAKGFLKQISILIGILVGTITAIAMGTIDFAAVGQAHWAQLPQFFYFSAPKFEWSSIATLILAA
ncbi:Uric acid permease PucJ, partial [Lactobacillus delbrueckii subsp. bulgaricus]|nr:Uric acid permease PucJ [Lactobacillus delbrueckii subsp. bulgaricus]